MGGHSILSVDKHAWNAGAPVCVMTVGVQWVVFFSTVDDAAATPMAGVFQLVIIIIDFSRLETCIFVLFETDKWDQFSRIGTAFCQFLGYYFRLC